MERWSEGMDDKKLYFDLSPWMDVNKEDDSCFFLINVWLSFLVFPINFFFQFNMIIWIVAFLETPIRTKKTNRQPNRASLMELKLLQEGTEPVADTLRVQWGA